MRSHVRHFRKFARLSLACAGFSVLAAAPMPGGEPPVAFAETLPMTLIRQDLALAPDAPLTITFLPPTPITPTDSIIIGAYRRIDSRQQFTKAISGEYGRVLDSVRIDPADPAAFAVDADGQVTITIPSESATGTPAALQFPRSGLYPITVDVQAAGGSLVSELLTFVDRLPVATDQDRGRIGIAVVATITAAPQIPGADTPLPSPVIEQIEQLLQYPDTAPFTVSISPEILDRLDAETLDSLSAVMARNTVLAQPSVPFDPSAAAAAGQQDLFTELLQAGEDQNATRTSTRADRSAWIEQEPLTTEGASLLRSRGVGLLLLSPETYTNVGIDNGFLGDFTLYSQLRDVQLSDGSSIPAAVFDPTIDRHLIDTALSPELAALYTAADLVAWRDQLYDNLPPVTGNSVVLGLPAGGVLPAERVSRLVEMVTATGAGEFTDLSDLARITDVQIVDGSEAQVILAPHQPTDLTTRAPTLDELSAQRATVSSMLVEDGGRTEQWTRTIEVLSSTSITDAQVAETAESMLGEFDAITSAVEAPGSYTFTMNGLSTNLYPRITNTGDEALNVVVQLRSSADKMQFPEGDVAVTLLADSVTTVTVPVRARSNGSFTVTLQVLSPDGVTPITEPTILKAQVNALTGLAQVFTGGALLILLTWWVRNLRRSRRLRSSESSMSTHPTRSKATTETATTTATAATAAAPDSSVLTGTATATTGTSTITAVTSIAQLDTSSGTGTVANELTDGGAAVSAKDVDPDSTTLSDS